MINITKLVKWNISHPYTQRIGYCELTEKVELYRWRGKVARLHAQIRTEIDKTALPLDEEE